MTTSAMNINSIGGESMAPDTSRTGGLNHYTVTGQDHVGLSGARSGSGLRVTAGLRKNYGSAHKVGGGFVASEHFSMRSGQKPS